MSNLKKILKTFLEEEAIHQMDNSKNWSTKDNRSIMIYMDDLNSRTNLTDYYDNIHGQELY